MGTARASKTEVRKLQTTGEDGESYMITLPKELVESLGWRKGQKLTVHKYGKKTHHPRLESMTFFDFL